MESVASSHDPLHIRFRPPQPLADRIFRALRHRLLLLHRSHSNFFILGATANVYTVTLSSTPSCTCPDRTTPCKHILFVLIRVLGVSLDDTCLRRRTLRPCQLHRLLSSPTSPDSVAGERIRRTFHQMFFRQPAQVAAVVVEEGSTCPVCLEEIEVKKERVVKCGTCRNVVHEECFARWKRSSCRGRRGVSCVICRARWRDQRRDQEQYLNLSAYVVDDRPPDIRDAGEVSSSTSTCGGGGGGG